MRRAPEEGGEGAVGQVLGDDADHGLGGVGVDDDAVEAQHVRVVHLLQRRRLLQERLRVPLHLQHG